MSSIQRCGFCSLLSGLVRRALCIGSRRGSIESYYRELGDQDTLKIDGSQGSDDSATEVDVAFAANGCANTNDQRVSTSSLTTIIQTDKIVLTAERLFLEVVQDIICRGGAHQYFDTKFDAQDEELEVNQDKKYETEGNQDKKYETEGSQDNQSTPNAHGDLLPSSDAASIAQRLEELSEENMARRPATGRFLSLHRRRRRRLVTRALTQEAALLDDLQNGQVQCVLEQSAQWRFNAFTLDTVSAGRCLPVLCMHLFQTYGLISHFNLDPASVWHLFCMFEEGYHSSNPYHNSIHAADVTQAMHCFLQQRVILEHLEPIEVLASLVAAIVHDLDHPGVNQQFLIATSNHLAALYKNKSVLENHHWRSAISILLESQVLDQLSGYKDQLFRQISSLILATDITRQQEYLGQFKSYMDTNTLDLRQASHRHLILQIALKCADISNPCRPWEISRKWSLKVCEEFFRQGDFERRLNLPVTALCDRHSTTVPKIQTGFFKYVVTPLISEWHRFLKNDLSAQMLKNLVCNQNEWELLVNEELAAEAARDVSEVELVDDDDCSPNMSGSSEMLLPPAPPRRCSLNPTRPTGFGEQIRRFSVPLNVFQDVSSRKQSLVSNGDIPSVSPEIVPSPSEKLVLESSIASITTPQQATRIQSVFRSGRLSRQKTFPPLEGPRRPLIPRASSDDRCAYPSDKSDLLRFEVRPDEWIHDRENEGWSRVGDQLRDNLAALPLGLPLADLGRRRKSMPAEVLTNRENKFRELCEVLPQLIKRTISPREILSRRRGSAPAPGSIDRSNRYNGHNGNGRLGNGARLPRPCQLLARTPEPSHVLPRRSSLPVEVCHHTDTTNSDSN